MHTINVTSESSDQVLTLHIENKLVKLKCKTNWETDLWISGLRNAMETERILGRTQFGVLKYNVAVLHHLFSSKLDTELGKFVNSLTAGLSMSLKPSQFAGEVKSIAREVAYVADGLYAHRPFVLPFFKFVVSFVHSQVRKMFSNYWNQFFENLQASDVLALGAALAGYERTLQQWGVVDYKFQWSESVQTTYVSRVFENSKGPITNIIMEFEKNTFNENGKLHSSVCPALESHVYFLLGGHSEIPLNSFAEKLSLLANRVLQTVLIQVIFQMLLKDYPAKIYIAILNNYFLKMLKNFEKRVHGDTKSQISLKSIKELMGEGHLLELMARIDDLALKKLRRLWRAEITSRFGRDQTFFDFDLEEKLSLVISTYENDLKLVVLKFHIDELLFELFDSLLSAYFAKFVNVCESMTPESHKRVAHILAKDYKHLQAFFEIHSFDKVGLLLQRFRQLKAFFDADDLDECTTSFLNMAVFMFERVTPEAMGRLLQCKVFFPPSSIEYARNFLEPSIRADERQRRARQRVLNSVFLNRGLQRAVVKLSELTRRHDFPRTSSKPSLQDRRQPEFVVEAGQSADGLRPPLRKQGVGRTAAVRRQNR